MAQYPDTQEITHFLKDYIKPDDRKAWVAFGVTLLLQITACCLVQLNLGLLGWTLHTLTLVRMFLQFHDICHFSFFSTMEMNRLVGKFIGVYLHFPFQNWRDGHNNHHRVFANLDLFDAGQSILFTKKQYQEMKLPKKIIVRILREPIVFFFFSTQFATLFGVLYKCVQRYGVFSFPVFERLGSVVLYGWVFGALGLPAWQIYCSLHIAQALLTIIFHLHHACNTPYRAHQPKWTMQRAALQGSVLLYIPPPLKIFSVAIEYHHIHHFNHNVASYHLEQCHRNFDQLDSTGHHWDKYRINRVTWQTELVSLLNVMYDEENNRHIPFSYTSL